MLRDTLQSFGSITKIFHWSMALLVIGLLCVGFFMANFMEPSVMMLLVYKWHKQIGIVVLLLALARIGWRLFNVRPVYAGQVKTWEKNLARAVHVVFYASFILMPLSGWLMSSAKGFSVSFFGWTLPDLIASDPQTAKILTQIHEVNAYILLACLVMHIGGVLKHVFVYKDETLRRMLPKFIFLFVLLTAFPVQANQWEIDKDNSKLTFQGSQMGGSFSGEFSRFDGQIYFDKEALDKTDIRIEIDLSSVSSKSNDRDTTVLGAEWFDVKNHPVAIFTSTEVRSRDGNLYEADGTLEIRGVRQDISLPFTYEESEEGQFKVASVTSKGFTLNRIDFGIGAQNWADPSAVSVLFPVEFHIKAKALGE